MKIDCTNRLLAGFLTVILLAGCSGDSKTYTPANHAPTVPHSPNPAIDAIDQPLNCLLAWQCEDNENDSLKYDIYLGTTIQPPLMYADITTNSILPFDGQPLSRGTRYYWRVVAKDGTNDAVHGPLWNFVTVDTKITGLVVWPGHALSTHAYVTADTTSGLDVIPVNRTNVNPADGSFALSLHLTDTMTILLEASDDVDGDNVIGPGDAWGFYDGNADNNWEADADTIQISPGQFRSGVTIVITGLNK